MIKALIIGLTIVSSIVVFSPAVYAVNIFSNTCVGTAATTQVCSTVTKQATSQSNPLLKTLKTVLNVLSYIIGIMAVIVLIIAGLQFIIGAGDPQSVATARDTLTYALVGILVAVLAQSIVVFVLKHVG